MSKIYDTFTFFNELEILQMRFETLYDYVDHFVLVEANQTFTLKDSPKELTFEKNKNLFSKFLDKVIHVKLVDQFSPGSPWPNEFLQRNSIIKGLVKCQPEDVILMGDVDEIPDPNKFSEMVSLVKSGRVVTFKQKMYRYFLNIRCTHELWSGTRAISMQNLWDKFAGSLERLRHHDEIFIEGGHHFTGVQGLEAFMKKMESFSHNDICDVPKYRDPENMKKLFEDNVVNKGLDVHHFNRSTYFIESPDSDFLPKGIDKSKYEKMIYKGGEWR